MDTDVSFLDSYSYDLPPHLIAQAPVEPRDSSRLFAYDAKTDSVEHATFAKLARFIPKGALLVINETKVVPARIKVTKETGGSAELLLYTNTWNKGAAIEGISDRKLTIGQKLFFQDRHVLTVREQRENVFGFELAIKPSELFLFLEKNGAMPLPKYIKDTPLSEEKLKTSYQTTFAKKEGSVAAPTASLHFTNQVFKALLDKGVDIARLALHVGAGTFAPVTSREIASGKLHKESYFIPKETAEKIQKAKKTGHPVIAVGTTALRALETVGIPEKVEDISSFTEIFIRKPYAFKVTDGLITNFHVPKSSLMCLVDAFLDFKKSKKTILELYKEAIEEEYRFYSFGDGMLIL